MRKLIEAMEALLEAKLPPKQAALLRIVKNAGKGGLYIETGTSKPWRKIVLRGLVAKDLVKLERSNGSWTSNKAEASQVLDDFNYFTVTAK